ncbi:MAG: hypothetical protein PVJ57_02080 [Phycisphaerae bacterium]|jgi:hypothetical protein
MWTFNLMCDEFYVASRLFFKLDLNPSRETLLHFFEQVRRAFPRLQRLRRRDDGTITLDEEPDLEGGRRYVRLGTNALRLGQLSPRGPEPVKAMADMVFEHAPCHLSLSDLDYDRLEVVFGFDLEFAGNHDGLVGETLLGDSPLLSAMTGGGDAVIDCAPCLGVALSADCRTQAYLDVRGRTAMYELRSNEYETRVLSVSLTVRQDLRDSAPDQLAFAHHNLVETAERFANERVVPLVVRPLREAIATRQ